MEEVGVHGEGGLAPLALGNSDAAALCVRDQLAAAVQVPLPPGRDHLDVRLQPIIPARISCLGVLDIHHASLPLIPSQISTALATLASTRTITSTLLFLKVKN